MHIDVAGHDVVSSARGRSGAYDLELEIGYVRLALSERLLGSEVGDDPPTSESDPEINCGPTREETIAIRPRLAVETSGC